MIRFFVPGIPKPGGSKTAYTNKKTGKPIVTDSAGKANKDWRAVVALAGSEVFKYPLNVPVRLEIIFWMPRPKNHYGTGRNAGVLKPNAPSWHDKIPDGLKLRRTIEDALTGIAWMDDAQIVIGAEEKRYADTAIGAEIRIGAI
jgi:Holliday junction resolvase RusA-like endonuclease